jgi:hypothetical protein
MLSELTHVIEFVMLELRDKLRKSQDDQGHTLTGKLRDSIDYTTEHTGTTIVSKMYMEDYGVFVEFGVSADRIPYSGKGGRGGTSKYIQGLISFFELRGLSGREAVGAAFATAAVHKRDGMPTRRSSRFSKTGERTGFVRTVVEKEVKSITDKIEKEFGVIVELQFKDAFLGFEKLILN